MVAATRRRSPRLAALESSPENEKPKIFSTKKSAKVPRAKKRKVSTTNDKKSAKTKPSNEKEDKKSKTTKEAPVQDILPRTRETKLKGTFEWIMGIDEAGRGPLAGPVVAAAAVVPVDMPGITDSKKITCETAREELYEQIVASPGVSWAVAVVDAQQIDEINILQATMQGMSMVAAALVNDGSEEAETRWKEACKLPASASRKGCYVACGGKLLKPPQQARKIKQKSDDEEEDVSSPFYALVDGNRIPKDLPCEGEPIVKGDSKEYAIAAASILAKVTRDRLMHTYGELYPEYNLGQHKGYPTKAHMAAVSKHGASPIHRRSFAPLKHMEFDENGKVIQGED